jgi:enterochelin esterase-like enzyme
MKKIFILLSSVLMLLMAVSCHEETALESGFTEFEIKCQDGTVRKGGIYLPEGVKAKDELPVIYMADGLVFKDCSFKSMMDSLIDLKAIRPVVIACSYENKKTVPGYRVSYRNAEYVEALAKNDNTLAQLFENHNQFFVNEFIPYIEKEAPVSKSATDRIFFGTSNSADYGITLSLRNQGLISEYWCYSPVYSDIKDYGMLSYETSYRICWGIKEEVGMEDYFPNLLKDIRKRGGNVHSWVFNGGHDRDMWKYWFSEELKLKFPYKVK